MLGMNHHMTCVMLQEIDYELEGQNADKFRVNFQNTPWIKVSWRATAGFLAVLHCAEALKQQIPRLPCSLTCACECASVVLVPRL
jgi:hypothetical protein